MSVEVHVTFLFQNSTRSILITIIRVSIKRFRAVQQCAEAPSPGSGSSLSEPPPDVAFSSLSVYLFFLLVSVALKWETLVCFYCIFFFSLQSGGDMAISFW